MESKKPISFAAAAAAAAAKPAPATPASGTSTPSAGSAPSASPASPAPSGPGAPGKNGSNGASAQASPALGSQSPATPSAIATSDKAISSGGIDWVLGKHVKVVTQSDEVFEGQVYAYDVLMNCVVLHIFLVSVPDIPFFSMFVCRDMCLIHLFGLIARASTLHSALTLDLLRAFLPYYLSSRSLCLLYDGLP